MKIPVEEATPRGRTTRPDATRAPGRGRSATCDIPTAPNRPGKGRRRAKEASRSPLLTIKSMKQDNGVLVLRTRVNVVNNF